MTLLRFATAILVLCALSPVVFSPGAALACSVSSFDPVEASDVIFEGRITGWEVIEDASSPDPKAGLPDSDPNYYGPYTAIRVHLNVARSYKGDAPYEALMVTGNTMQKFQDQVSWVGSSGACGAFDEDPTNQWVILGLNVDKWGRYVPSRLANFYIGDEASGDAYQDAVASLGPASLPNGGGALAQAEAETKSEPWPLFLAGAFLVPLAVLVVGAYVQRRGGH